MAFLNEVSEREVIEFFKTRVHCTRDAALRAVADSKQLMEELLVALDNQEPDCGIPRAFSTGMIRSMVSEFLTERQRCQELEDREWKCAPPQGTQFTPAQCMESPQYVESPQYTPPAQPSWSHVPYNLYQNVPQHVPHYVPQQVHQHVHQQVPQYVPEHVAVHVPQQVLEHVPQHVSQQVISAPQHELSQTSDNVPCHEAGPGRHNDDGDSDMRLAIAVSQLQPDEFIVRATATYETRDPLREHSCVPGDIFVIDQVRYLNDGTSDAWMCGLRLGDTRRKWIFSDYTVKL